MKQMSLTSRGFELETKKTRKREFLDEMELVVPWVELVHTLIGAAANVNDVPQGHAHVAW